jgi:hypothetical protein
MGVDHSRVAASVLVHAGMADDDAIAAMRLLAPIIHRMSAGATRGVMGVLAEHDVCRVLGLMPAPPLAAGYDAVDPVSGERVEIKSTTLRAGSQRVHGSLSKFKKGGEATRVLLAVYDFQATLLRIIEVPMAEIVAHLAATDSGARKRGVVRASTIVSKGRVAWPDAAQLP